MAVLAQAQEVIPGKPIRYVVTSHHHWDHLGGIRAAIDEGATIVTHASNREFLQRVAKTPHTITPDRLAAFEAVEDPDRRRQRRAHRRHAGGRMFVSPRVRYVYYVRNRVGSLFRQFFQDSFWRIPVLRKHKKPTTLRQVVPLLFFLALSALVIAGVSLEHPLVAVLLPAVYIGAMVWLSLSQLPRMGWLVASLVPVAVVTMHVAYASGMAYGLLAALFRVRAWEADGWMSALSR